MNTRSLAPTVIGGLLALWGTCAVAQSYPAKTVTVVVPFSAGGPTDSLARIMAELMTRGLGRQVLVDNTVGASGTIGVRRVARVAPDG